MKCGMCMNCGKAVYDWTAPRSRGLTPVPSGARSCANLCMGRAIGFPDIEGVREFFRKEGIWER